MKNTIDLIMETAIKISHKSELDFLKRDTLTVLEKEHSYTNRELVERLEQVFTNANYAGDHKAGELSFLMKDYLDSKEITQQLRNLLRN